MVPPLQSTLRQHDRRGLCPCATILNLCLRQEDQHLTAALASLQREHYACISRERLALQMSTIHEAYESRSDAPSEDKCHYASKCSMRIKSPDPGNRTNSRRDRKSMSVLWLVVVWVRSCSSREHQSQFSSDALMFYSWALMASAVAMSKQHAYELTVQKKWFEYASRGLRVIALSKPR